MNRLDEAVQVLKNGWCQGYYRRDLPEGASFCAAGALVKAFRPNDSTWCESADDWMASYNTMASSDEAMVLAEVIVENYPTALLTDSEGNFNPVGTVISFNDHHAESADEVVAMFEKAAIKFDEVVA